MIFFIRIYGTMMTQSNKITTKPCLKNEWYLEYLYILGRNTLINEYLYDRITLFQSHIYLFVIYRATIITWIYIFYNKDYFAALYFYLVSWKPNIWNLFIPLKAIRLQKGTTGWGKSLAIKFTKFVY
jgi:hypothetical protein